MITQAVFSALLLMHLFATPTTPMTPEQVVQEQLEAYNSGDIERFMAVFSKDAEVYNFATCEKTMSGWEQVKARYGSYFNEFPDLHSELINRIVMGEKVFDHERITGSRHDGEAFEIVMIYEVRHGKIFKATSVRP